MRKHYILDDDGEPVIEPDIVKWWEWFSSSSRHVGDDLVYGYRISTIFTGISQDVLNSGMPLLWETMIFKGDEVFYQERSSGSREQAEAMHVELVNGVQSGAVLDEIENDNEKLREIINEIQNLIQDGDEWKSSNDQDKG